MLKILILLSVASVVVLACDQSMVQFPDADGGDQSCGSWYPGSEADSGIEYAIETDAIFPCLVWESVRRNHEDTWLNIGELYLSAKHGEISAKALIIAKVGVSCVACHYLVVELGNARQRLEPHAVMVALTHGNAIYPEVISLDEAESIIVAQEGWPANWYLTNDLENHFSESEFVGIPWVTVVNLETMRVLNSSNSTFSASNVDELVSLVENL